MFDQSNKEILNQINDILQKANNFDEGIRNCIYIILNNSIADYAVIWYKSNGNDTLKSYYWNTPNDLTTLSYGKDENLILSRALELNKPESIEFENCSKVDKEHILLNFHSIYCLPFNLENMQSFGCLEFIKLNSSFTDEEKNICKQITENSKKVFLEAKLPELQNDRNLLISISNLNKSYKNGDKSINVLNNLNFKIFEGEFLVILGESGCGKTTLLNILGGILNADSGSLKFQDKEIIGLNKKEITKFRRENVGFIFQTYNLMQILTAKENLMLMNEISKNPMDPIEALRLVGIEDKADSYPAQLSRGQQQRVSIARALIKKQKLILADEPTAALDYDSGIEVLSVFENILKEGKITLIMVTHNKEIAKMADRVIRLKNGKIFETMINHRKVLAKDLEW